MQNDSNSQLNATCVIKTSHKGVCRGKSLHLDAQRTKDVRNIHLYCIDISFQMDLLDHDCLLQHRGHRSLWHFLKKMTRIIRLWYWFWNNILAFFTGPHERMSGKTTDDILYHSVRFCKESILSGKLKIPFLHWIWRYLRQWIKELWVKTVLPAVTVMGLRARLVRVYGSCGYSLSVFLGTMKKSSWIYSIWVMVAFHVKQVSIFVFFVWSYSIFICNISMLCGFHLIF